MGNAEVLGYCTGGRKESPNARRPLSGKFSSFSTLSLLSLRIGGGMTFFLFPTLLLLFLIVFFLFLPSLFSFFRAMM